MNKLTIALPALILFFLFAPNFVSAQGSKELLTTEPVETAVQNSEDAVSATLEKVPETTDDPSLSEPANKSVEKVKEVVNDMNVKAASLTEPIAQPLQPVIEKTEVTVKETSKKVEETIIKPVEGSLVAPVEEAVEVVEERMDISETVTIVDDTVRKTEKKLKDSQVDIVKEEEQSETSASKPVDVNKPTIQQLDHQVEIEKSDVVYAVEPGSTNEWNVRQGHKPANNIPLDEKESLNSLAITTQTIQVGTPSVSINSSPDLGVSAFLESLKMDFAAEIRWSNPEEAGKSQWSHAPPGEPPKSLSFLNNTNT